MRLPYPVLLAACSAAVAHSANPSLCPWIPPTPCLVDGVNEPKEFQPQARSAQQQKRIKQDIPPSKWEDTGKCAGAWCIFLNRGFANGEGTVAVTTRPNFEILLTIEAATNNRAATSPPYHIDQIPGKGLGVIANKTLHRGDVVMTEFPACLVHRGLAGSSLSPASQFSLLDSAVDALPPPRREAFLSQMAHFGGHRVTDILTTNSFQLNLGGTDGHHYGSFPGVSRYNHTVDLM
jgi:hypothetical protein